jgi:hypothetical protein
MPVNTPRTKIFTATYIGILVPTILVQTLGAALYSGTEVDAAWKLAYKHFGVGGPLMMALKPAGGFGKFLVVIAGLSSIPVCSLLFQIIDWIDNNRTTSQTTTHSHCIPRTSVPGHFAFLESSLLPSVSSSRSSSDASLLNISMIPFRRS